MTRIAPTALALLMLSTLAQASDNIRPDPGMWVGVTKLSVDRTNWRTMSDKRGCLTKEDATDWESNARRQIAAAQCSVQSLTVSMGKISGTISCATETQVQMKVDGRYDNRSYGIDLVSTSTIMMSPAAGGQAVPVKLYGKWTGRMVGVCS
jgi:hypothetical protein